MTTFGTVGPTDKKPATPARSSTRAQPNALRNAQVLPPHNVDLTLEPTTLEQIRAPSNIVDHRKH
ncbi:hypothetical protein [Rhizobium tubonense]|uniref:Uncharacterized protein n=1 Tax=Rhizobium tubonense TaxID=484088 RepID=A0A2W4C639_9HYPH|nr:hypothetical protein [Rhizobium tubonense]PZM08957.1 hypothetical protein CPY51_27515 [Rhizobium tubonense]